MLPGGIVARAAFLRERPALVARFVAVYLRAVVWQRANAAEAAALMGRFAEAGGTPLPAQALPPLLEANVNFALDEQLRLFQRTGNQAPPLERAFTALATYLRAARAIRELPNREVLKRRPCAPQADERLRTMARRRGWAPGLPTISVTPPPPRPTPADLGAGEAVGSRTTAGAAKRDTMRGTMRVLSGKAVADLGWCVSTLDRLGAARRYAVVEVFRGRARGRSGTRRSGYRRQRSAAARGAANKAPSRVATMGHMLRAAACPARLRHAGPEP
jgi:hypothetical protein